MVLSACLPYQKIDTQASAVARAWTQLSCDLHECRENLSAA